MTRDLWLITGASGLLGSNLALEAVARGRRVVCGHGVHPVAIPGAESIALPLGEPASVGEAIAGRRPRVVVHCAAETRVDWCEDHPAEAYRVNAEGARAVAAAAATVGAKVVYVSTDSVFDGRRGGYAEDDAPAPRNVYAASKLAGEEAVRQVAPNHLILRTNMFGWSPGPRLTLAEWILDRLAGDGPVPGFSDVAFSPLLVNDLGDVIDDAIASDLRGLFHAGARDGVTKLEFARRCAGVFGFDPARVVAASSAAAGLRAERPLNTTLDSSRLERALGRRLPSIDEGLGRLRQLRDNGFRDVVRTCVDEASWGANVSAR